MAAAGPGPHPGHLQWAPTPAGLRPPGAIDAAGVDPQHSRLTGCSCSLESRREDQPQPGPKAGGRPPATRYVHSTPKESILWRQRGRCAGWATCAPLKRWIPGACGLGGCHSSPRHLEAGQLN